MPHSTGPHPEPLGHLPGGEAYFAPIGEMRSDGERMQCHLCGRWYRMVGGSHLLSASVTGGRRPSIAMPS